MPCSVVTSPHEDHWAEKLLVALAARALIWEVHPPLQRKERASVVQAKEVYHWNERHGQQVLVPVGAPWPCPLLKGVMELLGVPAELTLDQQVDGGRMMPQWMLRCEGKQHADMSPILTRPACCAPERTPPMAGLGGNYARTSSRLRQ